MKNSRVMRQGGLPRRAAMGLFFGSIVSAAMPCLVACKKDTVVDRRTVTLYTFAQNPSQPACTVPPDAYAQYSAAGDFEPDPSAPPQVGVQLDTPSPALDALPASTKQLSIVVRQDPLLWRGFGAVADQGDVDVLLWPAGHECSLPTTVDARAGSQLAAYDDRHVLVTGGPGLPSFVADLSNGSIAAVSTDIIAPRTNATATAYPRGVVVIGGEVGNQIVQTAEFFENGAFSADPLPLTFPRTHHGAAALQNGNVIVVGGASASGLYSSIEEVDTAAKKEIPLGSFASLETARKDPIVLALKSGEILVAGGTNSSDVPVRTIEWFSSDVTQHTATATIDASAHEAFVALPAGGALGVVSPPSGPTTVWLVQPDHTVEQAPSIASLPSNAPVRLFAGAGGSPMLWTGASWFRWSPWTGAFVAFTETESASGGSSAAGPPDDATNAVLASPDPGLALWLDDSGLLTGLRFDARGSYSTDVKTLLATDTQSIAPDRLPGPSLTFDDAQGPGTGLRLGAGAQVVVADANYANFSLDFDTGKLQTPILFLRDDSGREFTIGVDPNATCVVPDANHWHVERRSGAVSVSADDAPLSTCSTSVISSSRLTVGLRGRSAPTTVTATARNLVIRRD